MRDLEKDFLSVNHILLLAKYFIYKCKLSKVIPLLLVFKLKSNLYSRINHFTVVCLVAWPLNESEAGGDLVLIETSLLFICKFLPISMRTASLT